MVLVLVSACLIGEKVRYSGSDATCSSPVLARWLTEGRVVRLCPEVAGGLGVPRPPAEIQGLTLERGGDAVLRGAARVVSQPGEDVTRSYLAGAQRALDIARANGVGLAILKESSPSCGSRFIYDGSFTGNRVPGQGVTAALLEQHGIPVFSDERLDEAAEHLAALEAARESRHS